MITNNGENIQFDDFKIFLNDGENYIGTYNMNYNSHTIIYLFSNTNTLLLQIN